MKLNFRSNKTVFNKGKLSKKKNFTPRTDPFFNYQLGEFKFEHPWGYTFFIYFTVPRVGHIGKK